MEKKKLGRPPIAEPKNVNLKIRLDKATNDRLEKYCKASGETRTEAIRQSLKQFLKYNT
jgi:predicted transcriptional regulator